MARRPVRVDYWVAEERNLAQRPCPPCARPGRIRSRSLRERRGCTGCKVACRMCGRTPPQLDHCDWRSSYEPPVRGHRHYRQIAKVETRTHMSVSQNKLIFRLAVVALLLLLGLLCCVVLVFVRLRRSRLGRVQVALDPTDRSLNFVDESN